MTDFQTSPNTFDSRDVIERIEELTNEFIDATESDPSDTMSVDDWQAGLSEDDAEELYELLSFAADADEVSDWEYGAFFIHVNEFTNYARETVEECGYVPADLPEWIVIDWEETADNMRQDYTTYAFRGEEYLARA